MTTATESFRIVHHWENRNVRVTIYEVYGALFRRTVVTGASSKECIEERIG